LFLKKLKPEKVVNALLTQLDKLKTRKNVLVVTTSNLSHSIDPAFVDRADIKQYIGLPPPEAVFWILSSCLRELSDKEIISKCVRAISSMYTRGKETEKNVAVTGLESSKTISTSRNDVS